MNTESRDIFGLRKKDNLFNINFFFSVLRDIVWQRNKRDKISV